jgi:hypothetical protein
MTTHDEIKTAMARAFFANAYAEQFEEAKDPGVNPAGCDWMDLIPEETDEHATHAVATLAYALQSTNPKCRMDGAFGLDLLFAVAVAARLRRADESAHEAGDRELTPELFGHYLAMQAMGTGVGLESFGEHVREAIIVPYVEFGSHSLAKDYFEAEK